MGKYAHKIYTNDSVRFIVNGNYQHTIHTRSVNSAGYVGIGSTNFWEEEVGFEGPRSLLHLQGPYNAAPYGGNGWRAWNRTGMYINENSDEMYIGMKNEFAINGANRSDAVIMWGDDQYTTSDNNADNFRLIFSGNSGSAGNGTSNPRDAFTVDGLETMRMTPQGRMGIGPQFTWSLPPMRRLEVLDYKDFAGNSLAEPQLRLTFTQSTSFGAATTTGKNGLIFLRRISAI